MNFFFFFYVKKKKKKLLSAFAAMSVPKVSTGFVVVESPETKRLHIQGDQLAPKPTNSILLESPKTKVVRKRRGGWSWN